MFQAIVDYIEEERQGVIATIFILVFFSIIGLIWGLISSTMCGLEQRLNLKVQTACENSEAIFGMLEFLLVIFIIIGTIGSIISLYILGKKIVEWIEENF